MSNQLSVTGTFLHASPIKTVGDNSYQVRDLYLDMTDPSRPEWPNTPCFNLGGERVSLPDTLDLKKGDIVKVSFDIRGRKYKKNDGSSAVFTTLQAWKIERHAANQPPVVVGQQAATVAGQTAAVAAQTASAIDDDLPF